MSQAFTLDQTHTAPNQFPLRPQSLFRCVYDTQTPGLQATDAASPGPSCPSGLSSNKQVFGCYWHQGPVVVIVYLRHKGVTRRWRVPSVHTFPSKGGTQRVLEDSSNKRARAIRSVEGTDLSNRDRSFGVLVDTSPLRIGNHSDLWLSPPKSVRRGRSRTSDWQVVAQEGPNV